MLKDITIGQYYHNDSPIHRLDPRTKLISTFIYIISLFIVKYFMGYLPVLLFLGVAVGISGVPVKYIFKGMRPIFFLLGFTMLFNLFLRPGDPVFSMEISFIHLKISGEGIHNAFFMGIRLTLLVIGTSLMTYTTTPGRLTDGLESILSPLKLVGIPIHDISMIMSIALRFIPILMDETDKIMKAQMARGADFESGNVFQRVKSLIPVLVPLFISSFNRAGDLAMAMEARCYRGGVGRTRLRPLKYTRIDAVAYIVTAVYMTVIIASGTLFEKMSAFVFVI